MDKFTKESLITRPLSREEFEILKRVTTDPFFFSNFISVIHPIRGKVPFLLYPYQKAVLYAFLANRFNIVLKFRQAGITELISLYCLWLAMYHANKNIVIISIKDRVAKKVLRKIKYMYKNLPDYLKMPVVNGRGNDIGTSTELEFANGSLITSVPTTEEAGRSEAVSLLVIDEAAIVRWISKIWAAAFPTLSTGGAAIVNSTPYGIGNWYHKQWTDALAGGSDFVPIRLHWNMHPERDQEWYQSMRNELGTRKTAQEIDGDFLTSGSSVFDLNDIRAIEECLEEHIPIETRDSNRLKIYGRPKKDELYVLGGDIATGRGNDYSAFSIMNIKGEEFASYKGKLSIFAMAELMIKTAKEFNDALVAPESNDIGLGTTSKIEELGYRNLYYSKALVREKGIKKPKEKTLPGWYTTKGNRPVIVAELEEDIRRDYVIIKDPEFVREAYTFIYDNRNKATAMGKTSSADMEDELDSQVYNDDAIMAKAITNHVRKQRFKNHLILPK